jgi:hypothetical protein
MTKGHLGKQLASLALVLPLLSACHHPGDPPVDTSLQDNSEIRKEARQQEIQRQMEQMQRAADSQRAQQMVPPAMFSH